MLGLLPKKVRKPGFQLQGLGEDSAFIDWAKTQNPLVGGAAVLGLSLLTGLVVSSVAVWGLNKLR